MFRSGIMNDSDNSESVAIESVEDNDITTALANESIANDLLACEEIETGLDTVIASEGYMDSLDNYKDVIELSLEDEGEGLDNRQATIMAIGVETIANDLGVEDSSDIMVMDQHAFIDPTDRINNSQVSVEKMSVFAKLFFFGYIGAAFILVGALMDLFRSVRESGARIVTSALDNKAKFKEMIGVKKNKASSASTNSIFKDSGINHVLGNASGKVTKKDTEEIIKNHTTLLKNVENLIKESSSILKSTLSLAKSLKGKEDPDKVNAHIEKSIAALAKSLDMKKVDNHYKLDDLYHRGSLYIIPGKKRRFSAKLSPVKLKGSKKDVELIDPTAMISILDEVENLGNALVKSADLEPKLKSFNEDGKKTINEMDDIVEETKGSQSVKDLGTLLYSVAKITTSVGNSAVKSGLTVAKNGAEYTTLTAKYLKKI